MFESLTRVGLACWETFRAMAPYLLFGFFAAGVLSVFVSARLVERHLGGRGLWPVFKAALFGIPLPLCSCSVIPVTASLRRHGASRGAATAFLISTPQTGVDSILVTLSLLGPVFAVFKPLAALVSGVVGGGVVDVAERSDPHSEAEVAACREACCADDGRSGLWRSLAYGFVDLPRDIGRPLLIGVIVAGAIRAFVPDDYFVGVGTGVGAILVMMLMGIPVYVCATASIPIAAALWAKGVSPGAVLAFLMTGPATNAAGIGTVWKVMGARTAGVYLFTVASMAFLAGLVLDYVASGTALEVVGGTRELIPGWARTASAFVLLGVLAAALLPRRGGTAGEHECRSDTPPAGHEDCCHHD